MISNSVGTVMYRTASSSLSKRELVLVAGYLEEQRILDEQLASDYQELIDKLDASMADYLEVLDRAFSPDVEIAFIGSVDLAPALGLAEGEVLDSKDKALAYFLE